MSTVEEQRRIIEKICRAYIARPYMPLATQQAQSSRDRPAKEDIWISRARFPAPSDYGLRDSLFEVIAQLKQPEHRIIEKSQLTQTEVPVEFIASRKAIAKDGEGDFQISEGAKLERIEQERKSDTTILYMHGGGLYFSSPAEYRASSTNLARLTGALVASTSYRLCPQNTFPAPLLDVLIAYATLLHPASSAANPLPRATPAHKIVLAGNSAGANLAFGLLKFLIELNKRPDPTIILDGRRVQLPLPAGIAVVSSWCDQTDCMPSWLNPHATDILTNLQPALDPGHPSDAIWPATPPREHPYTVAVNLDHELVSPTAVRDWTGAPPMWFAVGQLERGKDGNAVVAARAAECNVKVTWAEWEGMCHEWMILGRGLPQVQTLFRAWADACKAMVDESLRASSANPESTAVMYRMPDSSVVQLSSGVKGLSPLAFDAVGQLMKIRNRQRPVWVGNAIGDGKKGQSNL